MRKIVVIVFIIVQHGMLHAQPRIATSFRTGFNRVGLYFDQSVNVAVKAHRFDAGVRFYGPDFVFEKNVVGPSLGYGYIIQSPRMYFAPGVSAAFARERKTEIDLFVTELLMWYKLGLPVGQHWSFFSHVGLGAVLNRHTNTQLDLTGSTSYINYEIAFGIQYFLSGPRN